MSLFVEFKDIKAKYNVEIYEGENFKQAKYNGRMTDSDDCIIDKIELILKHYPNSSAISLSTYESDDGSSDKFCYAVVMPVVYE